MNVTISIQDCSLQELQVLFARLGTMELPAAAPALPAAAPLPEPEPSPEPAPKVHHPKTGGRPMRPVVAMHDNGTEQSFGSIKECADTLGLKYQTVANAMKKDCLVNGIWRFRYAEQPEPSAPDTMEPAETEPADLYVPDHLPLGQATKALRKIRLATSKPIKAIHDSGEVKHYPSAGVASQACGVSLTTIYTTVGKGVKTRGWMFEHDKNAKWKMKKGGEK